MDEKKASQVSDMYYDYIFENSITFQGFELVKFDAHGRKGFLRQGHFTSDSGLVDAVKLLIRGDIEITTAFFHTDGKFDIVHGGEIS